MILIPVLALLVAGRGPVAGAWTAQSRAEVLAHDLSIANGQLRSLGAYDSMAPAARPAGDAGAANPPLPPLPPMGAAGTEPRGPEPLTAGVDPACMRLLLVVPSYYPESYGGAERQASILAEAMARRGAQVTILAPTLKRDLADRDP